LLRKDAWMLRNTAGSVRAVRISNIRGL
jgi:hypothetical protein